MNSDIQARPASATATTATATATAEAAPLPAVVPAVDVYEDASGITLLADLPGVPRENLDVRVDGDTLIIEATVDTRGPREMELVYGEAQVPAYRRRFTLSRELDTGRIEAQLKDGVLQLFLPKAEEARPRKIAIQPG